MPGGLNPSMHHSKLCAHRTTAFDCRRVRNMTRHYALPTSAPKYATTPGSMAAAGLVLNVTPIKAAGCQMTDKRQGKSNEDR